MAQDFIRENKNKSGGDLGTFKHEKRASEINQEIEKRREELQKHKKTLEILDNLQESFKQQEQLLEDHAKQKLKIDAEIKEANDQIARINSAIDELDKKFSEIEEKCRAACKTIDNQQVSIKHDDMEKIQIKEKTFEYQQSLVKGTIYGIKNIGKIIEKFAKPLKNLLLEKQSTVQNIISKYSDLNIEYQKEDSKRSEKEKAIFLKEQFFLFDFYAGMIKLALGYIKETRKEIEDLFSTYGISVDWGTLVGEVSPIQIQDIPSYNQQILLIEKELENLITTEKSLEKQKKLHSQVITSDYAVARYYSLLTAYSRKTLDLIQSAQSSSILDSTFGQNLQEIQKNLSEQSGENNIISNLDLGKEISVFLPNLSRFYEIRQKIDKYIMKIEAKNIDNNEKIDNNQFDLRKHKDAIAFVARREKDYQKELLSYIVTIKGFPEFEETKEFYGSLLQESKILQELKKDKPAFEKRTQEREQKELANRAKMEKPLENFKSLVNKRYEKEIKKIKAMTKLVLCWQEMIRYYHSQDRYLSLSLQEMKQEKLSIISSLEEQRNTNEEELTRLKNQIQDFTESLREDDILTRDFSKEDDEQKAIDDFIEQQRVSLEQNIAQLEENLQHYINDNKPTEAKKVVITIQHPNYFVRRLATEYLQTCKQYDIEVSAGDAVTIAEEIKERFGFHKGAVRAAAYAKAKFQKSYYNDLALILEIGVIVDAEKPEGLDFVLGRGETASSPLGWRRNGNAVVGDKYEVKGYPLLLLDGDPSKIVLVQKGTDGFAKKTLMLPGGNGNILDLHGENFFHNTARRKTKEEGHGFVLERPMTGEEIKKIIGEDGIVKIDGKEETIYTKQHTTRTDLEYLLFSFIATASKTEEIKPNPKNRSYQGYQTICAEVLDLKDLKKELDTRFLKELEEAGEGQALSSQDRYSDERIMQYIINRCCNLLKIEPYGERTPNWERIEERGMGLQDFTNAFCTRQLINYIQGYFQQEIKNAEDSKKAWTDHLLFEL